MRTLTRTRTRNVGLTLAVALLAAACGGQESGGGEDAATPPADEPGAAAEANATSDGELDTETILLSYLHDIQNAHYYFAQDDWDEGCGIELDLVTAADIDNPLQLLVGGAVDYALVDPLAYIAAVSRGLPVIAIGQDVAKSPMAYTSFASEGIESPEDMVGHDIGIAPGEDARWFLEDLLEANLTPEQIEQVNIVRVGHQMQPLLAGQIDAYGIWTTHTELATLVAEGEEFNQIRVTDHGIDMPGNVIVVSQDKLAQEPDLVERVLAMTVAGMAEAKDPANEEAAIDATLSRLETDIDPEVLSVLYEALWDIRTSDVWDEHGPGWNDPDGYASAQDMLLKYGEIDESVDAEDLYTNEVLERVMDGGEPRDLDDVCGAV